MTQSQPHAGDPGRVPAPTFFDPSFERLPAPVAGETAGPGPVLLLFDRAADRSWAADAAVSLATGWHAAGRRTVLADLCLEDPFLHERIGMPNQDGVVDIFLYGASLARSARAVPGRGFYLISSGTYTPEPGAVLRNPRWEKIVAGFRDNNAALLLFVPSDAPELPSLRRFVGEVILLGGADGRNPLPAELADQFAVRAWLTPPRRDGAAAAPAARPPSPGERFPEPEPVPVWAQPGLAAVPDAGQELRHAAETAHTPAKEIPVPEPDWREEEEPVKKRRRVSPLLLILLLLAILAALVFLGPQYIPGFPNLLASTTTRQPEPAPKQAPPAAPKAAAPVTAAGAALPWSVRVAGYNAHEAAFDHLERLSSRFKPTKFFIALDNNQGILWWTVLAGMTEDSTALVTLRDQLIAAGDLDEDAVGRWQIFQARPLAYEVGEYRTQEQARARADSLNSRTIPVYVAPVPYSDGSRRWKVYAGAYPDSASSTPMRNLLTGASIPPRLVERVGEPPASPK